jgi:hypothetical protein
VLLACIALLRTASVAADGQHRLVVLGPDEELYRAISLALSAWGVETVRSDLPPPEPSQPEAVERATELARQLGVEAVVWISRTERGSLVWVFDARAGDVTTRILDETPPFDSAAAAAVALSVKTVLRSTVVAPPAERFGASPSPPPVEPARVEPARSERVVALEAGLGRHWVAEGQAETRLALGAVAWVAAARRVGISLEWAYGPGLDIDDERFQGRYRELVAGGAIRFRWLHEADISAALALGGAVHWVKLEGTLVESSLERTVNRVNGSVDLEANVDVHSGVFYLGALLGVAYSPAYQRYLVEGEPVFSPWPFVVGLGGYLGVELF